MFCWDSFYFGKLTTSILRCWLKIYVKHQYNLYTLDFYFSFLDESKVTKENQVFVIELASVNYSIFKTSKKWLLSMSYRYLSRLHFSVRFKNRPITRTAIFFNIHFFKNLWFKTCYFRRSITELSFSKFEFP